MPNIALTLRYDGTNYHGWQTQKNLPTVCQTIAQAVERAVGHSVNLIGCGRTDAGVHAETYVANFRTDTQIPADRLPFAIHTPPDITVLDGHAVPDDFHATFSCVRKEYTYRFYHAERHDPFLRNRSLFWSYPVSLDAWRSAAAEFAGTHDFKALRSEGTNVKTTVRTVYYCEVIEERENHFALKICANGFLYNMVRAITGTVLYKGLDKLNTVDEIFASRSRSAAGPTVPPHGLYMTGVWY
ncbi:tRNA pseudouridine synthase A [Clostridia bacterium]|nr:tRNA pseudouridine synthase A [Clostridia bacterium]